jgi:hypothetical protein
MPDALVEVFNGYDFQQVIHISYGKLLLDIKIRSFSEQIIALIAEETFAGDTSLAGRDSSSMKGYFTLRRSLKIEVNFEDFIQQCADRWKPLQNPARL